MEKERKYEVWLSASMPKEKENETQGNSRNGTVGKEETNAQVVYRSKDRTRNSKVAIIQPVLCAPGNVVDTTKIVRCCFSKTVFLRSPDQTTNGHRR